MVGIRSAQASHSYASRLDQPIVARCAAGFSLVSRTAVFHLSNLRRFKDELSLRLSCSDYRSVRGCAITDEDVSDLKACLDARGRDGITSL